MNRMRQLLIVMLLPLCLAAQGQIPAEVTEIMKKCSEKSHHEGGSEIDMDLHVGADIASMNGTMKLCVKGDKSFTAVKMKALGHEMYSESGFDGKQSWTYKKAADKDERDSLIISSGKKKKKRDKFDIDLGLDKEYKKAKLKTTDKFYEITFTGPLKEDMPKKSVLRIVKDTYMLHQYEAKVSIATMKMTVTKIKLNVSDAAFVFDPKKYPDAVVVRK